MKKENNVALLVGEFKKLGHRLKYSLIKKADFNFDASLGSDNHGKFFLFSFSDNYYPDIVVIDSWPAEGEIFLRVGRRKLICGKWFIFDVTGLDNYSLEERRLLARGRVIPKLGCMKFVPLMGMPDRIECQKNVDLGDGIVAQFVATTPECQLMVRGRIMRQSKSLTFKNWHKAIPDISLT